MPFTVESYRETTGFALPSLYLLSHSNLSVHESASDDGLLEPVFEPAVESIGSHEDTEEIFQSALIGSSSEWESFFADLEIQVARSEAEDAAKQASREAAENKQRERMKEEIVKAEEEVEALETLRKACERRVSPKPTEDGVIVSVRHINLGILTWAFPSSSTISAVYDWIGSLNLTPKHFRLTKMPNTTLYADESVTVAEELLSMSEENTALPLAPDENEVTFFEGIEQVMTSADTTLPDVADKPPEVLLAHDEDENQTSKSIQESNKSLEAHRQQESNALEKQERIITVSRHNTGELFSIYADPDIDKHRLEVYFDEDSGSGDGTVCEMFSLFWESFVMLNCEGSSQYSIQVSPAMGPDDYVTMGRILTNGFLLCGCFPVQLARASLHQAQFGSVDECLDSFLMLLSEKERNTVLTGLDGKEPFPLKEAMDILDD